MGERRILDEVYGERLDIKVIESECPDFLLSHARASGAFGVEVTEFFHSNTTARLQRIPGYVTDLLEGGDVRHKEDRRELDITTADVIGPDGVVMVENVPAVIQKLPSIAECAQQVADRILEKSVRIESSTAKMTHANLIICDRTAKMRLVPEEQFYNVYFVPQLIAAISQTNFREVFLITEVAEGRKVARLKTLYLFAEWFFFRGAVAAEHLKRRLRDSFEFLEVFASYLGSRVKDPVFVGAGRSGLEVFFGDSGLSVATGGKLQMRLYEDRPIPSNVSVPSVDWKSIFSEGFEERVAAFRESHEFTISALLPVAESAV